mgnify:CR=1 FL=1
MSGRKITLALIPIICLVILYLNYDVSSFESKEFSSKDTKETTVASDKSLPQMPLSTKAQVVSSGAKKNEDFGVFECLPDFTFDEEARMENITQHLESLDDFFSEAAPLYYALYANPPDDETRLDLLFEYYDQLPNSPVVSMDLISLCANSSDKRCTANFINDAIASDSNNGAIWVGAISFYATKGDDEGVMDSIEALEKASLFNERYGEKTLLYAQALEGSTSNDFNVNAIAGLGKAASTFPAYSPITRWCEQGLDEPVQANACLTLGKQLETRSKTLISKAIGIALQKKVFESEGDTDAIQLIEKKRRELTQSPEGGLFKKASIMLLLDERLLRSWLHNLDFHGELESQRLLVEEAEVLYEENENYLCTLIYEILDGFL